MGCVYKKVRFGGAEKFCNWTGLRRPIKVYMGGFAADFMRGLFFFGVVGVI